MRNDKEMAEKLRITAFMPDDGCDLAPHCLSCPLPQCRYDTPFIIYSMRVKKRQEELLDRWNEFKGNVAQFAEEMNVGDRTVTRMLKAARAQGLSVRASQ